MTYGKSSPTSIDDPEFVGVKQIIEHFIEVMRPDAYLVDRFPWLKYVPGYGRHLKMYHESDLRFYRDQLNRVKHAMVTYFIIPSKRDDVTQTKSSLQEMLDHHSREPCWKMTIKIKFPLTRWLSLLELCLKQDPTRYNPFFGLKID